MKRTLGAVVLSLLLVGCGGEGDDGGVRACNLYKKKMETAPEAIADTGTLGTIQSFLSDLDDPTRRAFAGLIEAADANPFLSGADRFAIDKAAAEVRTACLSEHSIDVPN